MRITYRHIRFVASSALLALGLGQGAPAVLGQVPISGIMAAYDNVTNTNADYSTVGGGSGGFPAGTTYNVKFDVGSQNNLYLSGFEIAGESFNFVLLADIINLARVNNSVVTGKHHVVLYEEDSVADTNLFLKTDFAQTMEKSLRSPIVNRGSDNVFCNTGNGDGNNNNIERIDYIFPDGFPVFNNIHQRGFLIMDRGGNDRFKIAAITGLDINGLPSAFGPPVSVLDTAWGDSGITIDTMVMRGYTENGDVQHPSSNVGAQPLTGVFISWQSLGLQTNDFIYGYSLAANDVTTNGAYWTQITNTNYFPTNTTEASAFGGLDLISGGMMFFEDQLDVKIGDYVWDDYNGNGLQDANEPGLSNVLVEVYNSSSNLAAVARTDANGHWLAEGIGPGNFFVKFNLPAGGYQFSPQHVGTNPAIDSDADPITGLTDLIAMASNQTNLTIDAGMHLTPGDLRLAKSVLPTDVKKGDVVVYTLSITNVGAEAVALTQVTDVLPAAVAFGSYGATTGTYSNATGIWDIGNLAVGAAGTLTITGTVNSGYGGLTITNKATITRMNRPDTNLTDNTASAIFTVQQTDLAVLKTVNPTNSQEGVSVDFTITLANKGPRDATGIAVTDLLPTGFSYGSSVPSQGSYASGTGIWTVGAVTNGGSASLVITATPLAGTGGTTLTNVATITASSHDDPVLTNNVASAELPVLGADLGLGKRVDPATASEGQAVVYVIAITNFGPSAVTGVTVSEPLTNGLTYVSNAVSQGSYNSGSGVWTVGALALDAVATLTLYATVDTATAGSVLTNVATITASSLPDPNPANDTDSATVAVSALRLDKTSDVSVSVQPGGTITYTMIVTNYGATTHTNLSLTDVVPDGTTYVPGSVTVARYPELPPVSTTLIYDASTTFTAPAGVTSVTASAWGGGGGGGGLTGRRATGGGGAGGAYAMISNYAVTPGSNYAITVGGGGAGGNTTPTDGDQGGASWFGAANVVYAEGGAGGARMANNNGTGAGAAGSSASSIGDIRNRGGNGGTGISQNISGAGGGGAGSTGAGGNANVGTRGTGTSLYGGNGANGVAGDSDGAAGSTFGGGGSGGIASGNTDHNGGAGAGGRVTVAYTLPPQASGTTNDPPNLASGWELEPGQWLEVTFEVTIDAPLALMAITNVASVTSEFQILPLTDTVVDPFIPVDLGVGKVADAAWVGESEAVKFTIFLTNLTAGVNATGVELTDLLPAGFNYVSNTASQGSYASGTGIWTVGALNALSTASLDLYATAAVGSGGLIWTNTVTITALDQTDLNPTNDVAQAVVGVRGADLALFKTVDNSTPGEGNSICYTIVVTNHGPSDTTGVTVSEPLTNGLTYVSNAVSQGSYNSGSGVWTVGNLNVGASATLQLYAMVDAGTKGNFITNWSRITTSDLPDPVATNDQDSAVIFVTALVVTKTSDVAAYAMPGSNIVYTMVVSNSGASTHSNVVVSDLAPTGTTYVPGSVAVTRYPVAPPIPTTTVYDASTTFTAPAGVTSVTVSAWGGGGGGATRTSNGGGGGGGGGAYSLASVAVLAGSNYTVNVGGGGGANTAGGDSWFSLGSTTGALARGGSGGANNNANGAAGGVTNTGIGMTLYAGGNGANGVTGSYGGGGGSSAGTNAAGNNAANATGAVAPAGGGDGGNGRSGSQGNGSAGSPPGGGGGGGYRTSTGTRTGGAGAAGRIIVTYGLPSQLPGSQGNPPNLASGWDLLAGQTLEVTFKVTVDNPCSVTQIVNTVSVVSDQTSTNVTATVADPVAYTDLALTKTVDDAHPAEGDRVTYTITVTNKGPTTATSLRVTEPLTNGLTYVSHAASQGSYASGMGLWTVGTLAVGSTATLTITVDVGVGTAGTSITNLSRISAMDQADPTPGDNEDTAVITVESVDVGVGKSVLPAVPVEKELLVYTVSVTNFGPDIATGVVVTDLLPSGLTYVSDVPSQGAYNDGTGLWTVGTLAPLQAETLAITARVNTNTAGTTITNVATRTATDQVDTNVLNDAASVEVSPTQSPLDIFKSVNPTGTVGSGDTLTYTIVVTNISAQTQTGVDVTDALSTNITYVSNSIAVIAPVTTNATFLDRFNARNYGNNDGTTNWSANWVESEGDGPYSGNVQVLFDSVRGATFTLRFAGASQTMARQANLSGKSGATLSFDYRRDGLEAGEYVAVEISSNGTAGAWTEIGRFRGAATDAAYANFTYDIGPWISTSTAVRFRSPAGMDATDILWIDDVQIETERRVPASVPGGAPPNLVSGLTLLPGESATLTFDVVVNTPIGVTQLVNSASVTSDQMTNPRTDTAENPVKPDWGQVSGLIWYDENSDGIRQPAETNRIANVPVRLVDANGETVDSMNSGANGEYLFEDVPPGTYFVRFDLGDVGTGVKVTVAHAGGDPAVDSDVTRGDVGGLGETDSFVLTLDESREHIDLGLARRKSTRAEVAEVWGEWENGRGRVVWKTSSEWNTAGFFLYRVDPETGTETRLNEMLVASAFDEAGAVYGLMDSAAAAGGAGTYRLEEIELSGVARDLGTHEVVFGAPRPAPRVVKQKLSKALLATPKLEGPSPILKVLVRDEGIYGIGLQALADGMGLALEDAQALAAANRLALTQQGEPVPAIYDAARARLVFHGRGADNWYARDNAYFIAEGAGLAMPRREPGAAGGEAILSATVRFEQDKFPFDSAMTLPEDFYYWEYVLSATKETATSVRNFPLDLTGAVGDLALKVRLMGWSSTSNDPDHLAEFLFNGQPVGSATFDDQDVLEANLSIPVSAVIDGVNTLAVKGTLQPGRTHSYFVVDWIEASFARTVVPLSGTAYFAADGAASISAAAFAEPLALALDAEGRPTWIADANGELSAKAWAVAGGDARFIVAEANALSMLEPEAVNPDPWFLKETNRIDYLVLTSRALESAAQELADYRAGQGLRVGVATFEDVCDWLAGGLRTPEAIPELLGYAKATWAEAPWLVVLAGNGHYDYLDALNNEPNHLPPLLMETADGIFAADGLLADGDFDGEPDAAIGRLPARDSLELTAMIAKIKAYEADFGSAWQDQLVLAADANDAAAGDFSAVNTTLADLATGPYAVAKRIDLDASPIKTARADLLNQFKAGAGFIHYTGHGGVNSFSSSGLLKATDVDAMANARKPVVVALSCLAGRFEAPKVDSLGEILMRRAQGGAVAVWAPSGLSLNDPAAELGEAFYRAVLQEGSGTLGLAIRQAHRSLPSDLFSKDTFAIYNLLGDPALRIAGNAGGHPADETFAQWRWQRFAPAELADAGVSGATAANFRDYALGGEDEPVLAELPEFGFSPPEEVGTDFILRWKRRVRRADVEYRLFLSHDLETWSDNSATLEEVGSEADPDGVMETVRTRVKRTDAERTYLGIRAKKK